MILPGSPGYLAWVACIAKVAVLSAFSEPGRVHVSILGFAAAGGLGQCRRSGRHAIVFIGLGCIRACLHLLTLLSNGCLSC